MDLAVFYPYPESFAVWRVAGAGLAGLLVWALALWAWRKRPHLAVGWIWYVVTLLPVIGLIQVGDFSRADRFTYVPLIGVFLGLTWGAYELTRGWRYQVMALSVAGCTAIGLCLALTREQLGYWQDSETLFRACACSHGEQPSCACQPWHRPRPKRPNRRGDPPIPGNHPPETRLHRPTTTSASRRQARPNGRGDPPIPGAVHLKPDYADAQQPRQRPCQERPNGRGDQPIPGSHPPETG